MIVFFNEARGFSSAREMKNVAEIIQEFASKVATPIELLILRKLCIKLI